MAAVTFFMFYLANPILYYFKLSFNFGNRRKTAGKIRTVGTIGVMFCESFVVRKLAALVPKCRLFLLHCCCVDAVK
jgi:hypothetical protein